MIRRLTTARGQAALETLAVLFVWFTIVFLFLSLIFFMISTLVAQATADRYVQQIAAVGCVPSWRDTQTSVPEGVRARINREINFFGSSFDSTNSNNFVVRGGNPGSYFSVPNCNSGSTTIAPGQPVRVWIRFQQFFILPGSFAGQDIIVSSTAISGGVK